MKWVTYRGSDLGDGERAGVLSGDTIYAAPRGVTLLDLIGRGADGLRQAGEEALRLPVGHRPAGRRDVAGADPATAVDPGFAVLPGPHA